MKVLLFCLGMTALLLLGCVTHSYLPFYNTAQWNAFYQGGDGSTTAKAVILNTTDDKKITEAEKRYLDTMLTAKGNPYVINNKIAYTLNGKVYDKYEVTVNSTLQKEYHFDITLPAGQNPAP